MAVNLFYNDILIDHNLHPLNRRALPHATRQRDGKNPSCGDTLTLSLQIEDGRIVDAAFQGEGCAISQASADILTDLCIGRSVDEVRQLYTLFHRMITGTITSAERETLAEAAALEDISHMPQRVRCAMLAWDTLQAMLDEIN